MTRTLVSFEAPASLFPADPAESGDPAGKEIADLIAAALHREGIEYQGPDERGGWAWDLRATSEHASIECIIGLVDDAPIQWLIATSVRPQRRFKKRAREETEAAAASLRDAWIKSIDDVCGGPQGWTSVRWYHQTDFDRDHGETWSPTPFN